jgi:DnaJ-class molecular chaperone
MPKQCSKCNGGRETCPACHGAGKRFNDSQTCEKCNGNGTITCRFCQGSGEVK